MHNSLSEVLNCDNIEFLKETPDNYFDLAVVDPPYGKSMDKQLKKRGETCSKNGFKKQIFDTDWDSSIPSDEYFEELFRVSKNQIIFGGNYFPLPPTPCWLVWDKGQRNFSFADAELAWTSFKSSVRVADISRSMSNRDFYRIHPTQKPIALYCWIYDRYAKKGDRILDTHLGSGSSRIAAYEKDLEFLGIEADNAIYLKQEERFRKYLEQVNLFETQNQKEILFQLGMEDLE